MTTSQPASQTKTPGFSAFLLLACAMAFLPGLAGKAAAEQIVSFQHGVNGYSGVEDTYILSTSPTTVTHSQTVVQVRTGWQGLLRFDEIFGNNPDQIPAGAEILSAKLTLTIARSSGDSISMHRLLVPWTGPAATWNFFDNGISVADGEAHATPDQVFVPTGALNSPLEIDVKTSVQAWADGAANQGWVFFSDGTDTFRIYSSEHSTAAFRPSLAVSYASTGPITIIVQPTSQTAVIGQRVEFYVGVSGSLPRSFQWRKEGVDIPGATNQTHVIPSAIEGDAGAYSVVASNLLNQTTSEDANLSVNQQTPLALTAEPQGRTVDVGANVTLWVEVSGSVPRFQWYQNNRSISGATNQSHIINQAAVSDSGSYHVVVTNLVSGLTSAPAFLLVVPPAPRPTRFWICTARGATTRRERIWAPPGEKPIIRQLPPGPRERPCSRLKTTPQLSLSSEPLFLLATLRFGPITSAAPSISPTTPPL
jgi:hypothetical protein